MKLPVLLVITMSVLVGCGLNKTYDAPEANYAERLSSEEYKIGVGDQLSISSWNNRELSVTVPVRPDGKISVPLVGDVQAAGVTAMQLAATIRTSLTNYIRTPEVTVVVAQASSSEYLHRARVTGAVAQQLSVPHRKGMTVLDLVLAAGGLTPFASGNSTILYRATDKGTKSYPIYLDDIIRKGDLRSNYPLMPGDVITVPERVF